MDEALGVREFWFGKAWTGTLSSRSDGSVDGDGATRAASLNQRISLWFEADPALMQQRDELIKSWFLGLLERAANGELDAWADSPRRLLSLIIVLDQFPRHIHRGTAEAFAYDERALGLALSGMQSAADAALNVVERIFFYMPLQHAESAEVQDESAAAYRRLTAEAPAELRSTFEGALESALKHRELIRRFGRFPHRNRLLQRANTPAEEAYLKEEPDTFNQ